MSIIGHRATIMAAAAGSLIAGSGPAFAQVDQRTAATIMVECSKIGDATARLACYDNNIRNIDPGAPLPPPIVRGGAPTSQSPQGFGYESVRQREERFTRVPDEQRQMSSTISAVAQRGPGIYLVTLIDGAEWLFAESVDNRFRPPQRGQTIEIERGALGSFHMSVDDQRPIRVRRQR